jgi:hypothetical protein
MTRLGRSCIVAGLLMATCSAMAGPTGLNAIPIADILGHREIYLNVGAWGTERRISKEIDYFNSATVGFGDRMEFGYDNDFEGYTTWNVKVLLFEDEKSGRWALSGGYVGLRKDESQSYLVGRYDLTDRLRLHAGWLEDGKSRSMLGLDYSISDNLTFMADSISGRDSYTYLGLNAVSSALPGFDLTLTAGIPHQRDNGYIWSEPGLRPSPVTLLGSEVTPFCSLA